MTLRWLLVLRTENPYANISGYFPDCTSSEYSAQPAMPPFLNLHTQKNILENLHRNFKYGVLVQRFIKSRYGVSLSISSIISPI